MSFTALLLEESRNDVKNLLNSARYYLNSSGGMAFSASTDITELVLASMTD